MFTFCPSENTLIDYFTVLWNKRYSSPHCNLSFNIVCPPRLLYPPLSLPAKGIMCMFCISWFILEFIFIAVQMWSSFLHEFGFNFEEMSRGIIILLVSVAKLSLTLQKLLYQPMQMCIEILCCLNGSPARLWLR